MLLYLPSMVTVNVQLFSFADLSVARHCTVLAPISKVDPDKGLHLTTMLPSTLSVALAGQVTMLLFVPVIEDEIISAGHSNSGGMLSETDRKISVTLKQTYQHKIH